MNNLPTQYNPARNIQPTPMGQELMQLMELSSKLASCPFYQKMGAGGVLAICLTARELNLPFMMCLNGGLYTFDGKVTMSAQLMNMMIVNAGHRADVINLDERSCKIRFFRRDRNKGQGDTFEYEFTLEMAQKAGYLSKDNWKKSPRDMLFSRCLSGGARKYMPDVLMNCYVFGEIIDDPNFDDSHLVNVVPDIAISNEPQPEKKAKEEPKQIEFVKAEGYDEFVTKHGLHKKDDGEPNAKYAYVLATSLKANMPIEQVINSAIKHEAVFEEKFSKWAEKNIPTSDLSQTSEAEI